LKISRRFAIGIIALLAVAGCDPYWVAKYEVGNLSEHTSDGGGCECNSGIADSTAVNIGPFAHSGNWAAKSSATAPPESGTRLFRWEEPRAHDQAYYTVWLSVPDVERPTNYWNIFQFKSSTSTANDPFWILNIGNRSSGAMYFYLYDWKNGVSYEQSIKNLPQDKWTEIEVFLDQSASGGGRITVWQDDTQIFDRTGITTKYSNGDQQWSFNNYSDGFQDGSSVIYFDDAMVCSHKDC
jgi:hypothetical protein